MADAEIQQHEQPTGGGESDVQKETAKLETQEPVEAVPPPSVEAADVPNTEAPAAPLDQQAPPEPAAPVVSHNGTDTAAKASEAVNNTNEWQQKEAKLLEKIDQCETVKTDANLESLKLQLKVREEEIELLKARVVNLETELQAALSKPGSKNQEIIESIKVQHEELLSKARGMIFDKTKMVKNQELQIQALTTQVASLKDINLITKDLLEIRNSEVKAMEDRLAALEGRIKAEKERHALQLQKTATTANLNDDLRKEYETQLALFKDLRVKYDERVKALIAENEKLKDVMQAKAEAVAAGANVN